MKEREFRPLEEFKGFGETPTIDDVADAILKFGPGVITEGFPVGEYRMNVQAVLISAPLAFCHNAYEADPEYRRFFDACQIYAGRNMT